MLTPHATESTQFCKIGGSVKFRANTIKFFLSKSELCGGLGVYFHDVGKGTICGVKSEGTLPPIKRENVIKYNKIKQPIFFFRHPYFIQFVELFDTNTEISLNIIFALKKIICFVFPHFSLFFYLLKCFLYKIDEKKRNLYFN